MVKNTDCIKEKTDGKSMTVILSGELDHHNAVKFRTEIDGLIQSRKPKILILDVEHIDFMDSSGLGLIMGRYSLMQKLGGAFALRNPNERIVKIFELAGLSRIVRIENDSEEVKNESEQ